MMSIPMPPGAHCDMAAWRHRIAAAAAYMGPSQRAPSGGEKRGKERARRRAGGGEGAGSERPGGRARSRKRKQCPRVLLPAFGPFVAVAGGLFVMEGEQKGRRGPGLAVHESHEELGTNGTSAKGRGSRRSPTHGPHTGRLQGSPCTQAISLGGWSQAAGPIRARWSLASGSSYLANPDRARNPHLQVVDAAPFLSQARRAGGRVLLLFAVARERWGEASHRTTSPLHRAPYSPSPRLGRPGKIDRVQPWRRGLQPTPTTSQVGKTHNGRPDGRASRD